MPQGCSFAQQRNRNFIQAQPYSLRRKAHARYASDRTMRQVTFSRSGCILAATKGGVASNNQYPSLEEIPERIARYLPSPAELEQGLDATFIWLCRWIVGLARVAVATRE